MNKELDILLLAVQEAGDAILKLQKSDLAVSQKANKEIVTTADLLANEILYKHLMHNFSDYGWLSEESTHDQSRLSYERVWVIDPIDGTKEYASGLPEYAVSVALVEKGMPILAAVYNPATRELYHAVKSQGAKLNGQAIKCTIPARDKLLLLASRSEYERGEWGKFAALHEVKQVGSIAYKLALVAAGKAHATFSLGPKSEWDIAAGTLLIEEAGGIVTNQHREKFIFNQEEVLVKGIVASTFNDHEKVFSMIEM